VSAEKGHTGPFRVRAQKLLDQHRIQLPRRLGPTQKRHGPVVRLDRRQERRDGGKGFSRQRGTATGGQEYQLDSQCRTSPVTVAKFFEPLINAGHAHADTK
jgi:hypothetical protein